MLSGGAFTRADGDFGAEPAVDAADLACKPVVPVAIASLSLGPVLRVDGIDAEHVAVLSELGGRLPPVVVHRPSMQVVDGAHRVRAAAQGGQDRIPAVFVEGSVTDAFILAVRLNRGHGLPLSRRDRRAAVERLLVARPGWSDRRVAEVAGVGHSTVAAVRRGTLGEPTLAEPRLGKDGRTRPRDPAAGRRRAAELLDAHPEASLRHVARTAGVSPATVIDVRRRRKLGLDPVPAVGRRRPTAGDGHRGSSPARAIPDPSDPRPGPRRPAGPADYAVGLDRLRMDPSFRFSLAGKTLIRLLAAMGNLTGDGQLARAVPAHNRDVVASLARQSAGRWLKLAEELESTR